MWRHRDLVQILRVQSPDRRWSRSLLPQRLSQAQVKVVLQVSVRTLIERLAAGEALCLDDLGRLWVEDVPPQRRGEQPARRAPDLHAGRPAGRALPPLDAPHRVPQRAGTRRRATTPTIDTSTSTTWRRDHPYGA